MTSQTFNLDLIPQGVPPIIHVSQYDKGQTWFIKVFENGVPFEIPEGCGVTVQGTKPDNTVFQYACVYAGSIISATLMQQMTAVVGDVITEIRITQNNSAQIVGSLNFITRVEDGGITDSAVVSETDISLIEQALELVDRVPEIVQECEQYVIASGDNADYAEKFAAGTIDGTPVPNTDPAYQNNAKYYKEQADADATAAAGSATSAETNAKNAEAWGVGERGGVPVESTDPTYENNAKYYAGEAHSEATDAAASELAASGSASDAADSATLAESYAKGGTSTRAGEDTDNAKYYMEQAAQYAGSAVDFRGATASQDGAHGLVPAPLIADKDKFLKGDGTWSNAGGGSLSTLSDVTLSSPTNGQVLKYDSVSGKWINGSGGTATTSLANLTDVNLTSLVNGQLIQYDAVAQKWVNIGVDAAPTQNSSNPVTSGGVYSALPSTMTGATAGADGAGGLVPKPNAGDENKVLTGAGTWGSLDGKVDKTDIAPVEATATASQPYNIGEEFYYNNILYVATANISGGGTITPNTNCTAARDLVTQINAKEAKSKVLTQTLATGNTQVTFTDAAITADCIVEIYTDKPGLNWIAADDSTVGTLIITYPAQTSPVGVRLIIRG